MSKKNVELSTGRKVQLKEMSIDDIDFCSDIADVMYNESGEVTTVRGVSKSRTAWIRRGVKGGDFKDFSLDPRGLVTDSAIKELNEVERNELLGLIQEYQKLGE